MFIRARLKNMFAEFKRLNGFMFTPRHIRTNWNLLGENLTIIDVNGRCLKHDGEFVYQKVDAADRLAFVIGNIFSTYYRNIVVESNCTHPHEDVFEEWDGDSDFGYFRQLYCRKCQGYTSENEIDQYLEERNPEGYHKAPRPRDNWERDTEDQFEDEVEYDY